jgi:hypothetical protein
MESPEEMKEKVEVCPSCGTLNRVPSAARCGGTVRCARCQKDFSREDKVKLYNRELVCDKCVAFLEDIEKVALPEATDEDLAAPPPRSVFSGWLGCLVILFLFGIPAVGVSSIIAIRETIAAVSVASCLDAVFKVAWFSFVIWVSVLFFRQKRLARIAIVALFIVEAVIVVLAVLSGHTDWTFLVAWGVVRIPMVLYLLLSKRVKETFVN